MTWARTHLFVNSVVTPAKKKKKKVHEYGFHLPESGWVVVWLCDWQYFDDVIFNLILIHLAGWEDACHFSQETKTRPYQSHSDCPVNTDYTCWKWQLQHWFTHKTRKGSLFKLLGIVCDAQVVWYTLLNTIKIIKEGEWLHSSHK